MLDSKLHVNLVLTNKMNINDVPEYIREDVRKQILKIDSNFFNTINEGFVLTEKDIENIINNNQNYLGNK